MQENVLVLGELMKYLQVKYQNVCNLLSNGSKLHIYRERYIHYWQMLKLLNLSEESMYYIFHYFVGFQKSFSKSKAEIKLAQTEGIRDYNISCHLLWAYDALGPLNLQTFLPLLQSCSLACKQLTRSSQCLLNVIGEKSLIFSEWIYLFTQLYK